MNIPNRLLWINSILCLAICISRIQCGRIEYEYDYNPPERGCDYPRKLSYQINVPQVQRTAKTKPSYNYGYKIEKANPAQTKTHVSYTFDFTVEEPSKRKPEKPDKLKLYTKIDRGVRPPRKQGYDTPSYNYEYKRSPAAAPCNCGEQQNTPAHYRYVYENATPCKCKHESCKCNKSKKHEFVAQNERVVRLPVASTANDEVKIEAEPIQESKRSKRDLRQLVKKRLSSQSERAIGRYMKKYHTKLTAKRQVAPLFPNLARFGVSKADQSSPNSLRELLRRRNKRDIKGEYDLIEKERAEMDLTLPDIIQYMPETLQPGFKRGQCQFNCQQATARNVENSQPAKEANEEQENAALQPQKGNNKYEVSNEEPVHYYYYVKPYDAEDDSVYDSENNNNRLPKIKTSFAKRNAMNYDGSYNTSFQYHQDQPTENLAYNDYNNNNYNAHYQQTNAPAGQLQPMTTYSNPNEQPYAALYPTSSTPNQNYPQTMLNAYTPTLQQQQHYTYQPAYGYAPAEPQYDTTYYPQHIPQNPYYPQQLPQTPYYKQQIPQTPYYTQHHTQTPYYPQQFLPKTPIYTQPQIYHHTAHYPHSPYPAVPAGVPSITPTTPYVYDDIQYLPNYGHLPMYVSGTPIPDPAHKDGVPLYFTGDLHSPPHISYERIAKMRSNPLVGAGYHTYPPSMSPMQPHPVQHLSNAELDKIIQDIIYRHPDFIDATSHYGGALVDPEPQQKVQTIGFLKKLINGRLHKWFAGSSADDEETDYKAAASTAYFYLRPNGQLQRPLPHSIY